MVNYNTNSNIDNMKGGERVSITLKAMRYNRGMNQKQAAKAIGVAPSTLSFWETGKSIPSVKHLRKLCEVYRCTAEDIFFPVELTKG